jgi:hypothetical protein
MNHLFTAEPIFNSGSSETNESLKRPQNVDSGDSDLRKLFSVEYIRPVQAGRSSVPRCGEPELMESQLY